MLKAKCDKEKLFEDELFPSCNESIYKKRQVPDQIKWMRPKVNFELDSLDLIIYFCSVMQEANPNAKFIIDGFDHCDMDQGKCYTIMI